MSKSTVRHRFPAPDRSSGPARLRRESWGGVLRRSVAGVRRDQVTDWAAALAYYSVISLFPGLLVVTALMGMAEPSATRSLVETLEQVGPQDDSGLLVGAVEELRHTG